MAETMTLAELKAKNSAEPEQEQESEQVEQEDSHVTIELEHEEVEEINEEEGEQEEGEPEPEVESWMQEEVATPDDDEDSGFKPNPLAAKLRKKYKAKLSERDEELESLRAEIESLKSGAGQPAQVEKLPPRPRIEDFDSYEEHEAALDEWYDKRAEAKVEQTLTSTQTEQQQRQAAEQQKKAIDDAVNRHYTRAAKLVESGKISEEKYAQADRAVRESFERLSPDKGDMIVDSLIKTLDSLGEGSEKVMYQLGVNPARMQEVSNLFASDPSGLSAVAYLGKLQGSAQNPGKRKSSAPPPSPELRGGGKSKSASDALLKRYKKAGNDVQARLDIKREAKRQGVDTRNWSD